MPSSLKKQPQFMYRTPYGGRRGGQLPCSSEHIPNWTTTTNNFQNTGKFTYGGLLKRPYGPSDNYDMKGLHLAGSTLNPLPLSWNYKLGQFGSKKKRKGKKSKGKRKKRRSKLRSIRKGLPSAKSRRKRKRKSANRSRTLRKFGTTPGTKNWKTPSSHHRNPVLLYLPVPPNKKINKNTYLNLPMQFTNNQMNTPNVRFGSSPSLVQMEGPNNVAYRMNNNIYLGAGANTINWATNKTYRPSNKPIYQVQKTKTNPRSWIANTVGIKNASSKYNTARRYTNLPVSARANTRNLNFGYPNVDNLVYTRDNLAQGAKVLYQPTPPYMKERVHGSYATKHFGRKTTKNKPLRTQFGGKVITLTSSGKITIKNSK